jgi:predicted nucleotidyltransferase
MQFGLPDHTLKAIRTILVKYSNIQSAILYGSRAKGNYKTGSDIDITLQVDDTFCYTDLLQVIGDFDDSDIPYMVDVSDYRKLQDENLRDHIMRVGKFLYKKESEASSA